MEEPTAFEILAERVKERGLDPITHRSENRFVLPGPDRFNRTKFVLARTGDLFFLASDSYGTKQYTSGTFTGIYSAVDTDIYAGCRIYKKEWTDRFFRVNKIKTGIDYIDSNLTVTSLSDHNVALLLKQNDVNEFLELHELISPLKIIFENDYISTIESLAGKKVIGLETNYWVYEDKELDALLVSGVELVSRFVATWR